MNTDDFVARLATTSKGSDITEDEAAVAVNSVIRLIAGRWKLDILFRLFDGKVLRFNQLERHLPTISQKVLIQQLKALERDGLIAREAFFEVPARVEYRLTGLGEALCPALDALVCWSWLRDGRDAHGRLPP